MVLNATGLIKSNSFTAWHSLYKQITAIRRSVLKPSKAGLLRVGPIRNETIMALILRSIGSALTKL